MDVEAFFDEVIKNDEKRRKNREAFLDALEAQLSVQHTSTVAILAAIRAEREAITAARKSMASMMRRPPEQ